MRRRPPRATPRASPGAASILPAVDAGTLARPRPLKLKVFGTSSRPLVGAFAASIERLPAEPGVNTSEFRVDLRAPGVPVSGLLLDVATQVFERAVHLGASNNRTYWAPVGGGVIYRADATSNPRAPQNLRLDVGSSRKRHLRLTVHDGNNSPLDIKGVSAEYRVQELVFRAETPGAYALYLGGSDLSPPSYDLASVLSRTGDVPIQTAELGPWAENPRFGQRSDVAGALPFSERYKVPASIGLAILLAALGLWTFRLLKRAKIQ